MKNIVVSSSTSSRVSWLQVWKQMHLWLIVATVDNLMVSATTARGREEGTHGAAAILKEKNVQCCLETQHQWILFNGNLKNWVWTLRRDTPEILRMQLGQKWILERKWQSGGIIWGCELHERNLCAPRSEEQPLEETSRQADWTSKAAWNLARNFFKLKPEDKTTFYSLVKAPERQYVYCASGSFNAQCWASWLELRYNGHFEKVWNHHVRLTATGDSANQRVNTSFRSWSRSVRNSAITRWNASDSVASWALLKTRIFIWVENSETPQSTPNGKTIICIMDNPVPLVVPVLSSSSSSSSASTSGPKDQSNSSGESETSSDAVATRSAKLAPGSRGPAHKKKTRCTHERQRKAFLFGDSPSQFILRTWRRMCPHITLKEWTQIRKVTLQKKRRHTNGSTVFMLTAAKNRKSSVLRSERWWLDSSKAENLQRRTWISGQSPKRCRGTRSRHSVESVSNPKLHRRRRRIYESLQ